MDKLTEIRKEEAYYHRRVYLHPQQHDQWLDYPVSQLIEHFAYYPRNSHFLDLGCGNGRNSLPLAKKGYQITAIDMLPEAIELLERNAFGLSIQTEISTIEEFTFRQYDGVFAVSSLEHLYSLTELQNILNKIKKSIKNGGSIYLVVNSEVKEFLDNKEVFPFLEINLTTKKMVSLLQTIYYDWVCEVPRIKKLEFKIQRTDGMRLMQTNAITFIAKKK